MRSVAYLMFLYALFNIGHGFYDQRKGVTTSRSPRGVVEESVLKRTEEERFWNLISYRFSRGAIFLIGGFIVLGIARRYDACDPSSPDFAANVKDEPVDPMLEEELRKRRGGLR